MKLARFAFKLRAETTLGQIWEAIREWIEGSPYSRFKGRRMLPTKIGDGEARWEAQDDCVTLSRAGEAMRVTSARTRRGLRWRTDLAFTRLRKFVRGVVEMHIVGSIPEGDIEVKEPIIVKRLRKTYGLAEVKSKSEKGKSVGEGKSKVGKPMVKRGKKRLRAKVGELTQEDVAKDFGVQRQTVIKWEDEQTVDGPDNASNPYHYYRALRLDPNLRVAYTTLVNAAKSYLAAKDEAKERGVRFRVTFERFNERFQKHNQKT